MRHYRDTNGDVYGIGEEGDIEGDQSSLVQPTWVLMTDEEFELFKNPPKTPEQIKEEHNAPILAQIQILEAKQARPIREAFSADEVIKEQAMKYLKQYNDQIIALRGQLL